MQKLGIDFDGVIQDSSGLKKIYCQTNFGIEIPLSQGKREFLTSNKILTEAQYDQMVNELYETELGLNADMVKDADITIEMLAKYFEILIVTSRSNQGVQMAKKWLISHQMNEVEVVGTDNREKLEVLKGFDHYIDDDLSKLLPLINHVNNLYLFSWEYNLRENLPLEIKRVSGWKDIEYSLRSE